MLRSTLTTVPICAVTLVRTNGIDDPKSPLDKSEVRLVIVPIVPKSPLDKPGLLAPCRTSIIEGTIASSFISKPHLSKGTSAKYQC